MRIGPRMREICSILKHQYGGKAKALSHVYMELDYNGGSSNYYGSRVMDRAMQAGLVEIDGEYKIGHPVPVRLTDKGVSVAAGEV